MQDALTPLAIENRQPLPEPDVSGETSVAPVIPVDVPIPVATVCKSETVRKRRVSQKNKSLKVRGKPRKKAAVKGKTKKTGQQSETAKKPKKRPGTVARVKLRKKAEKETERRLAPLREELLKELSSNMRDVAGEPSNVHVSLLRLRTFMHFLSIFLPFLVFWNAEEEQATKRRTRKTRKAKEMPAWDIPVAEHKSRKPRIARTVILAAP